MYSMVALNKLTKSNETDKFQTHEGQLGREPDNVAHNTGG